MISLHHQIVNDIQYEKRELTGLSYTNTSEQIIVVKGRDYFRHIYSNTALYYNYMDPATSQRTELNKIFKTYEQVFHENQDQLGHYFRNLYQILRLIDESDALKTHEEKMVYIRIIRAQLSTYEHLLLFYNTMSKYGRDKFKPLIDKYDLFDNMNNDLLLNERHKELYSNLDTLV